MIRVYLRYAAISISASLFGSIILFMTKEYNTFSDLKMLLILEAIQNCIFVYPLFLLFYNFFSIYIIRWLEDELSIKQSVVLALLTYYFTCMLFIPFPFCPILMFLLGEGETKYGILSPFLAFFAMHGSYRFFMMFIFACHIAFITSLALDYKKYNEFANRT